MWKKLKSSSSSGCFPGLVSPMQNLGFSCASFLLDIFLFLCYFLFFILWNRGKKNWIYELFNYISFATRSCCCSQSPTTGEKYIHFLDADRSLFIPHGWVNGKNIIFMSKESEALRGPIFGSPARLGSLRFIAEESYWRLVAASKQYLNSWHKNMSEYFQNLVQGEVSYWCSCTSCTCKDLLSNNMPHSHPQAFTQQDDDRCSATATVGIEKKSYVIDIMVLYIVIIYIFFNWTPGRLVTIEVETIGGPNKWTNK